MAQEEEKGKGKLNTHVTPRFGHHECNFAVTQTDKQR